MMINACCGGAGNCKPGDCELTRPYREEIAALKARLADDLSACSMCGLPLPTCAVIRNGHRFCAACGLRTTG